MQEPFKTLEIINNSFGSDKRAFIYTGKTPTGARLVRWNSHKRIIFLGFAGTDPIGRQRLLGSIQRYSIFKGHQVDGWVFFSTAFRQNAYRIVDEHKVLLVEIPEKKNRVTLLGTKNLPDGMLPILINSFESNGIPAEYDFDGLISNSKKKNDKTKISVASKSAKKTAFISYSWDSDKHRYWVLKLASDLIKNGVIVKIDEWDLPDYDNDLHKFMETGIRESDFVLMICTKSYAERVNNRKGGVGVESTIITGEYYDKNHTKKYIPIIKSDKSDRAECLPSYLKSKLAIDFSDGSTYEDSFESLLRRIAGKPKFKKPELGSFPDLPVSEI